MKTSKLAGTALASLGLYLGMTVGAHATLTPIANNAGDLQSSTAGVVGWATPNDMGGSSESDIANDILYLNAGGSLSSLPVSIPGENFYNNTAGSGGSVLSYGGGTVTDAGANVNVGNNSGTGYIASGYQYVIAKYGGPTGGGGGGGGYILFYLGGESVELPQFSYALWGNNATQYNISDYTEFNTSVTPVPEPSTIFAAALLLMPLGMGIFRTMHKTKMA